MSEQLHLAVALEGAGWHPAAWREPAARPTELLSAGYWIDQVQQAERGLLDFVTIEDSFSLPEAGAKTVRGRLDAVLIATRVAPTTNHIGLLPTALVTHTEPFHLSKAIATLDFVSTGRAGVRVQVSAKAQEAAHFGRRQLPDIRAEDLAQPQVQALVAELFDEAADYVEVIRRLWDSWEDDAEIRDAATGRFVDRDKLHYIDFEGKHFSVKGPSIVPRSPQGQPLVAALAHAEVPYRFAAASADIVFVTPGDTPDAQRIVSELSSHRQGSDGAADEGFQVFADLEVYLDTETESGSERKRRLDQLDGSPHTSDALIFTGSVVELADLLAQWQESGITGYRLRPGVLPTDLDSITTGLVPELQSRGLFRISYESTTLRGHFGLDRPESRYSSADSYSSATSSSSINDSGVLA